MLFGPLSKSIFDNYSYYVQTRVHVRVRALLTQLVFEHSLRIRMKAEAEELESSGSQSSPANAQSRTGSEHTTNTLSSSSAANTPISEVEDVETDHEHDDVQSSRAASTVADSSAGASPATPGDNGNPSDQKKKKAPEEIASTQPPKKPSGHAENLIGKMNNLVTSDLIRITDGCDFLTVGEPCYMYYINLKIRLSRLHRSSGSYANDLFYLVSLSNFWMEVSQSYA